MKRHKTGQMPGPPASHAGGGAFRGQEGAFDRAVTLRPFRGARPTNPLAAVWVEKGRPRNAANGAPPRLQQPVGEVAALPELRHGKLDRAHPRVPAALAVTVTAVDPLRRALPVGRAAELVRLPPLSASAISCTIARNRSGSPARAACTTNPTRPSCARPPPCSSSRLSLIGLREDDAVVSYHPDPPQLLRARPRLASTAAADRPQPAPTPRAGTLLFPRVG